MKLLIKFLLSADLILLPLCSELADPLPVHISQKEDIQWIYKSKDGMIYRRKFNYTSDSWIGEWELCLSSFTDEEIEEAEQYADEHIAEMKDHGATESTVILKLDRGGLLWNTVTDIREQCPDEKGTAMYLDDVWKFEKEECLKTIAKKHKSVN